MFAPTTRNILIIALLLTIFTATPVLSATTLSFSPSDVNTTEGESFTLIIGIDPQGIKNYTAKVELEYPIELLEAQSFVFGSDWLQLNQSGYDLIDNTNGRVIKTAGYSEGFLDSVTFGTISFLAKRTGEGIIRVGEDSIMLDVNNQNVFIGPLSEVSFTVREPISPPLPEEEIAPEEEIILSEEEIVPEEEVVPTEEEAPPLFDVLMEPAVEQVQKSSLIPILGFGAILLIIVWVYISYRKRKKKVV